jgi:DNA-binding NtrC family response regulator
MPFSQRTRVLIIDDDHVLGRFLASYLEKQGFELRSATNAEEALRLFRIFNPNLVIMDFAIPGTGGLETLERMRHIKKDFFTIIVSAQNDPEMVFKASRLGVDDYLKKPVEPKELERRILQIVSSNSLPRPVQDAERRAEFSMLFGTSPKMEDVKMTIEKVADTNATVLIRGESGTGKEMVARMIYSHSGRHEKPFVKVNCAAIPSELLESELFGYEQGAFTGATRQKPGKFDQANNGTLFLDEISEMHPSLQAKLLHVLQDGEFARLGGKRDIAVDVRVLAATNKALERAVADGIFREDLFYRLNVVTIHIPPLRERREEIPVFLEFFLQKYSQYYGKRPAPFSDRAVSMMMEYAWPGNIRELENLVKRYTIVGNEAQIIRELSTHKPIVTSVAPLTTSASAPNGSPALNAGGSAARQEEFISLLEIGRRAAMKAEREAIERVLAQTRWNRRQAAKILKISYKALLNKLKLMEEQDQSKSEQRPA